MEVPYRRLIDALQRQDNLLAGWRQRYQCSRLHLDRADSAAIEPLVAGVLHGLGYALPVVRADGTMLAGDLTPGSNSTRDMEKAASVVGAAMAALGASGFAVAASISSLRDVLIELAAGGEASAMVQVFEWLQIVAMDAYATARVVTIEEKVRAEIEQGTPVVLVAPTVPAVFLVGAPGRFSLDTILSRLLLLIVRVGAPAAVIDATGLADPGAPGVCESLYGLASHRKVAGKVALIAAGLTHAQKTVWADTIAGAGCEFFVEPAFMAAVDRALACSGYEIRSRLGA